MDGRYEHRSALGRLGVLGSALGAIGLGVVFWLEPAGPGGAVTADTLVPVLIMCGVLVVAAFLYLWLVGQYCYWALDEQGVSWRGLSMRRRQVRWNDVRELAVVRTGRSLVFQGSRVKLELRSGETCVIRPSHRYGRLEPRALELLAAYGERYGIVWERRDGALAMTAEEKAAAIGRAEAVEDDERKLASSKDELEGHGQGRLF